MSYYPYLNNQEFLRDFDNEKFKTQFIRITLLNFQTERAIASIEGKSTGGSCNLSATSNMRRVASCTALVGPDGINVVGYSDTKQYYDITEVENLISMNKKVKIETGFINTLAYNYTEYENYDVIWFPLGTYVIKNANISKSNSGINISLTLNDKCALLNGDMGGVIPASTVFSELEYIDDEGQRIVEKLLIKDIIKHLVVDFGGQLPENVIISDIDDYIVKVMKWNGKENVYLCEGLINPDSDAPGNPNKILEFENRVVKDQNTLQTLYKKGQNIGYVSAPFVYPGTLECNAGETVASVLDKIKNTLGNYEWFFDIDGRFIFRRIRNYLNNSIVKDIMDLTEQDYLPISIPSKSTYTFDERNSHLISSISKAPQYSNIKNDYVIWGSRKGASGAELPIHYHLAFDNKPVVDSSKKRLALVSTDIRGVSSITPLKNNYTIYEGSTTIENKDWFFIGSDSHSNPIVYKYDKTKGGLVSSSKYTVCYLTTDDWRTELYYQGLWGENQVTGGNPYYAELSAEWPKIWDPIGDYENPVDTVTTLDGKAINIPVYEGKYKDTFSLEGSDYWLDFLEGSQGGMESVSQFNIHNIGRRTKVINEKSINCLVTKEIPNYIYIETSQGTAEEMQSIAKKLGYETIQVSSEVYKGLSIGGGQNPAIDKIKELLYTYTQYNESISLSIIPIYHLEPNTRITVHDNDTGIHGDYLIKSISLPLTPNGTSNVSATRCLERTI